MSSPKKIVLAYSGGLDTSVILPVAQGALPRRRGWWRSPPNSARATSSKGIEKQGLQERRRRGAWSRTCARSSPRTTASRCCARTRPTRPTTCSAPRIARPLIAKHQVLRRAPDRRRRRRPRRHRQGQRPGPLRADVDGARPDAGDHLAVEGPAVPRRRPQRSRDGDRLRAEARHPDHADARRRSTRRIATSGTSRTRAPRSRIRPSEPNGSGLHDHRAAVARRRTRPSTSRSSSRPACRSPSTASSYRGRGHELIAELNEHRRQARRRPGDAGREPPGRHEEPRRLRDARRHDPLRGAQGARAALPRARPLSLQAAGRR